MRIGSSPARASTSASPSFAAVIPIAPAASWRRAISGVLGVLKWGRSFCGRLRKYAPILAMLSSTRSRSRINAGVSISDLRITRRVWSRGLLLQELLSKGLAPGSKPLGELGIAEPDYLGGEEPGVGGAWLSDRHGCHRHALWHLDNRKQRIHPVQRRGRHRHADHRQNGLGRYHAGQMGRPARPRDDGAQAALGGARRIFQGEIRRAIRGQHPNLMWNFKFGDGFGRGRDVFPIALAAHDYADERRLPRSHVRPTLRLVYD